MFSLMTNPERKVNQVLQGLWSPAWDVAAPHEPFEPVVNAVRFIHPSAVHWNLHPDGKETIKSL